MELDCFSLRERLQIKLSGALEACTIADVPCMVGVDSAWQSLPEGEEGAESSNLLAPTPDGHSRHCAASVRRFTGE